MSEVRYCKSCRKETRHVFQMMKPTAYAMNMPP